LLLRRVLISLSSKFTKYKAGVKAQLEEDFKHGGVMCVLPFPPPLSRRLPSSGGQRSAVQVLSNSFTAACLCIAGACLYLHAWRDTWLADSMPLERGLLGALLGYSPNHCVLIVFCVLTTSASTLQTLQLLQR
jgi:hypothetical protein